MLLWDKLDVHFQKIRRGIFLLYNTQTTSNSMEDLFPLSQSAMYNNATEDIMDNGAENWLGFSLQPSQCTALVGKNSCQSQRAVQ